MNEPTAPSQQIVAGHKPEKDVKEARDKRVEVWAITSTIVAIVALAFVISDHLPKDSPKQSDIPKVVVSPTVSTASCKIGGVWVQQPEPTTYTGYSYSGGFYSVNAYMYAHYQIKTGRATSCVFDGSFYARAVASYTGKGRSTATLQLVILSDGEKIIRSAPLTNWNRETLTTKTDSVSLTCAQGQAVFYQPPGAGTAAYPHGIMLNTADFCTS